MAHPVLHKKHIPTTEAAHALAKRLPRLAMEARRVALTIQSGIHGRRKSGSGETFWQFRPFMQGEAANRIDWRRSSRDDSLYVREREWETAHTIWLWIDQSPSMDFKSDWAIDAKNNHATILGLALADILMRSGERVGLWDHAKTTQQRDIIDQLAVLLIDESAQTSELPALRPLDRFHDIVLLTDGLSPLPQWQNVMDELAHKGARGHLVLIRDPAEITLPYEGHYQLHATEGSAHLEIGDAAAFRHHYQQRIAAHRDGLKTLCAQHHWLFHDHCTDKPLLPILLALAEHISQRPLHQKTQG